MHAQNLNEFISHLIAASPSIRGLIASRHSSTAAAHEFRAILQNQLNDIQAAGTYKNERVITSPQKTIINIEGNSRSVVNFCANNYLGLSVSIWSMIVHQVISNSFENLYLKRMSILFNFSKSVSS